MQIVVTVEELEAYQVKVRDWAHARVQFKTKLIKTCLGGAPSYAPGDFVPHGVVPWCASDVEAKKLDEWERQNPFPTIISRV